MTEDKSKKKKPYRNLRDPAVQWEIFQHWFYMGYNQRRSVILPSPTGYYIDYDDPSLRTPQQKKKGIVKPYY